jgi:hypothetical protein
MLWFRKPTPLIRVLLAKLIVAQLVKNLPAYYGILIFNTLFRPNVMTKWLALLLHIREDPGSNLGPDTDYPD